MTPFGRGIDKGKPGVYICKKREGETLLKFIFLAANQVKTAGIIFGLSLTAWAQVGPPPPGVFFREDWNGKEPLRDSRAVTPDLIRETIATQLGHIRSIIGGQRYDSGQFPLAAKLFEEMMLSGRCRLHRSQFRIRTHWGVH